MTNRYLLGGTQTPTVDGTQAATEVPTIAALKALAEPTDQFLIGTLGHTAAGDGGFEFWYWDSSSSATDDSSNGIGLVSVVRPTGSSGNGRWLRLLSGSTPISTVGRTFETIAALRATTARYANERTSLLGYYAAGDGGGGEFYWDAASVASDNSGTVILPTGHSGAGRWLRVVGDTINVKWFGATGDGTTDDTTAIQAAIDSSSRQTVMFPAGNYSHAGLNLPVSTNLISEMWPRHASDGSSLTGHSTLRYTGSGTALTMTGDGVVLRGLVIRDAGTGTIGVQTSSRTRWAVEECVIEGFSTAGIDQNGGYLIQIKGTRFSNNGTHIRAASAFNAVVMAFNEFMSATGYHVQIGGSPSSSSGIQMYGNNHNGTIGGGYAVQIDAGVLDVSISGFRHEPDVGTPFLRQADNAFGLTIYGGTASGPTSGPPATMIKVAGGDITVRDVSFGDCTNAITLDSTSRRILIERPAGNPGAAITSYILDNSTSTAKVFIDNTSLLTLGAGQIKFPATQNASTNVNTLDDYEEGTWTPVLTFATPGDLSVTYATQVGNYIKVGKKVYIHCVLTTSAFTHATASGSVRITGLPFSVASGQDHLGSCAWGGITKANYTHVIPTFGQGGSLCSFVASGSGVAVSSVAAADMPSGGTVSFRFSGEYIANA